MTTSDRITLAECRTAVECYRDAALTHLEQCRELNRLAERQEHLAAVAEHNVAAYQRQANDILRRGLR